MESALKTMGYTKQTNGFEHAFNPSVYYTITEMNVIPKYTTMEIELAEPAKERNIQLGNMYNIRVNGRSMVIEKAK